MDGRPNLRNKAAFSNRFSGAVCMGAARPKKLFSPRSQEPAWYKKMN